VAPARNLRVRQSQSAERLRYERVSPACATSGALEFFTTPSGVVLPKTNPRTEVRGLGLSPRDCFQYYPFSREEEDFWRFSPIF